MVASAGRAVQVGMSGTEVTLRIGSLTEKELDLLGVSVCNGEEFGEAVAVVERNAGVLGGLISHRFELERAPEASAFAMDNPTDGDEGRDRWRVARYKRSRMSTSLGLGSTFAGCRLESVAGRGGMGVVFRATQLALGRPVALKAIAPELAADAEYRERFQSESQLAAIIDHPNVIPVYEAGESDETLYLIMRWIDGTDLRQLFNKSPGVGTPGDQAAQAGRLGTGSRSPARARPS